MKIGAIGILFILGISFIPMQLAIVTSSTSTTKPSSTINSTTSEPLQSTPLPQIKTFNPSTNKSYFGQDLGAITFRTDVNGFTWNTTKSDFMNLNLPTLGAITLSNNLVYFNSTQTALQLSSVGNTVNLFFKPSQYQTKISIEVNLLFPQNVCLPFTTGTKIIQSFTQDKNTSKITLSPVIKSGNEVFRWDDIPLIYAPTWDNIKSQLCMSLPVGITKIDPLALDGSGTGSCGSSTTCTVTLTTSTTNDVIIVSCGCYTSTTTFTIADVAGLTWTLRASTGNFGGNTKEIEWSAISAGTLTADVITITGCGGCYYGIVANGISGANTGSPFDTNVGVPLTDNNDAGCPTSGGNFYPCITGFSTTNSDDFIEISCSDTGNNNIGAGTGMTLIGQNFGQPQNGYGEYKIVSSAQTSQTFSFGTTYIANTYGCIGEAVVLAGGAQPLLFTLKVDPTDGGAIYKDSTTVLSSTIITISTSSIFTITAQEFASYIFNGWTGHTTVIQNTINPTQTVSVTATASTTESDTLSATFVIPSSGGGSSTDFDLTALVLILAAFGVLMAIRVKKNYD